MITICMSYYNRKQQLENTLASIYNSILKNDVFIVIVDDGSDENQCIKDEDIAFPHKLISINKEDKWWKNASYPNNIAMQAVPKETDVIILQNPENYHIGDIIERAARVRDNEYLAFACYYLIPGSKLIGPPTAASPADFIREGWVCHSKYKPNFLNYVCAFTPATLNKVGYFDERFYHGVCFDDNEWVERIHHLGINMLICDDPYAKHQFHERVHAEEYLQLEDINRTIRNEIRASNNYNWDSTRLH